MDMHDEIARVRGDNRGGAAEVARACGAALREALAHSSAPTAAAVREELARAGDALVAAQPVMAPVRGLVAAVVTAAASAAGSDCIPGGEAARARAGAALAAYLRRLETAPVEAAARAASLVPPGARILALSRSSTVLTALLEAGRRGGLEVVCLESRPGLEGRRLAEELAAAGIQATVAPDAAVATLVADCDLALVGADAIGDDGVVNKIGTRALALAARAAGVPCYVVADRTKLLPPGSAPPLADERPAGELWEHAPAGVRVWNRYFEATPVALFTAIVMEDGSWGEAEVERRRRGE